MSLFGSKKQNEIDKLVSENDELKNQLHAVLLKHGGYEELENNLTRVKKELADLQQKDSEITKNLLEHQSTAADREKYLSDLNSKILELEEIKDNLHSTIKTYDSQITLLEDRANDLDEKVSHSAEIEIKLADVVERKSKLDVDIAEKEQTFAYLSTIEREIQSDLDKERTELNTLKNKIEGLASEIEALNETRSKSEDAIVSIKQKEADIEKNLSRLGEEETKKISYINSLDEKITLNEEIKSNLEKTIADFISQVARNENQYQEQTQQRELLQNEILELRKQRDDLDNKLNLAKEQFELFQTEASKHTAMLGTLGDEIRKFEAVRDSLSTSIESLGAENEKLSSDVEEKKSIIAGLEENFKELSEKHLQTEKEFGAIVEKYMLDFEDVKKIKDETESELKAKREEELSVEKILLEKKSLLADKENHIALLEKEASSLTGRVELMRGEKKELMDEIAALRDSISNHTSQMTSLRYENEALQIKKSDIQRDLAFLMTQVSREYSEAEIKLRNINESVSAGNTILLELNQRISSSRETLKKLSEEKNDVFLFQPDVEDAEQMQMPPAELPSEAAQEQTEEPQSGNNDEFDASGLNPFSVPGNFNDD
jgi:chromosome segregation ATPase